MSEIYSSNNIDDGVDQEIYDCFNPAQPRSFFLFAGAGSGKTRSLVNVLARFKTEHGADFRLYRQKIAIITYTNAAADEISDRLGHDPICKVRTIHSFSWDLISNLTKDIKKWVMANLQFEILKLQDEQSRSRDLNNKTSIDRARKIGSKTNRIRLLDTITKFTYNPNGDNISKDSLNHIEVISIAAEFIRTKDLMQNIVISMFPIILVDESQDTKKEMVDALFQLQENKKNKFSLGLFGDMMQRIYGDGKDDLGKNLPDDWTQPSKVMNHRSTKRIVELINNIRKDVDKQRQIPRVERERGVVRLFVCDRASSKIVLEKLIAKKMTAITRDTLWNFEDGDIMTLILEHHMAANRMGFFELFEPLYKIDKLKTGLLDGTLPGLNLFTKILLPLVQAYKKNDKFSVAKIVKKHSKLLEREYLVSSDEQIKNLKEINKATYDLLSLWESGKDPKLIEVLKIVRAASLFPITGTMNIIVSRTEQEIELIENKSDNQDEEDDNDADEIIEAWDKVLQTPFSQVEKYDHYFSENSKFGTHQGVKGLQYSRVMVIADDEEARGFMFSYDKLFGAKELSNTDQKNINEGKETGIEKTRRLFYVACSRAIESLAIVAYTNNQALVKENAIKYGWFREDEIELL
ncbi:AAA family ATPase [Dyadobacter chenwenxiniae]|uniref:DNA 3'-5' helicase II n=1 Tax=Dyadobacter chenwenxiniae TaxID=2906456 RepID=A0A9X1PQC5_9BACT|nr:UvrD-helicase domain-containing protein [Dyadobacter chenwenxiniae]MCF0065108.1 AAA family ATPase [Dyadobacter chenwenxiniae]UON84620.1 AAA family ATPase [Dyadobacter chenwenxiniae]